MIRLVVYIESEECNKQKRNFMLTLTFILFDMQ